MTLRPGALVLCCLAFGVGCGDTGAPGAGSCGPVAYYEGRRMPNTTPARVRPLPAPAGTVSVRGVCREGMSKLTVRRGIPASVALFPGRAERDPGRLHVFLAEDLPLTTAAHPLHPFVYGDERLPDTTSGRDCRPERVTGSVAEVTRTGLDVRTDRGEVGVRFEGSTQVDAPAVDGVPRLTLGRPVSVAAVRCPHRKLLVARSVRET